MNKPLPFVSNNSTVVHVTKSVSLDWHSGPVNGFIQCPITLRCFYFELLEIVDLRVYTKRYSLKEVDPPLFSTIVEFLSIHQKPAFPVWFFNLDHEQREGIGLEVKLMDWERDYRSRNFTFTIDWDLDSNSVVHVKRLIE
jgi:hypothetical protein